MDITKSRNSIKQPDDQLANGIGLKTADLGELRYIQKVVKRVFQLMHNMKDSPYLGISNLFGCLA